MAASNDSPIVRIGIITLGGLLIVATPIIAYSTILQLRKAQNSTDWPTVEGKVIESNVDSRTTREKRGNVYTTVTYFTPKVRYQYEVDGRFHVGTTVKSFELRTTEAKLANDVIARYPKDAPVQVHYNPDDTKDSVLEPGIDGSSYIYLGIPLITLIAGAVLVWIGWRRMDPPA